jgi:hypothetical protein
MAVSFKGTHFPKALILMGIRWYVAYPLSYRHIEELMEERGVEVDTPPSSAGSSNTVPPRKRRFIGASVRCR